MRQVRRIIAANMERWAFPPPLAEDVQLVVSELLTNAVIHSGADEVTLTLRFIDGFLRIDVRDGVLKPEPRLRSPSPDAENGRGLFLVQTIAGYRQGAWGVSEDGTTTWCELAVT
ncbi:ATP-binding region ATPase domain protein [Streptomyces albus]|uniref:ATP-binding region ATPase domain protein n=1 Tax=Streptomyces albus (strain ATCC 21838 / DSM 41398 / FERM P-419 / JCM 4703 / NBRC 107858) TaxID=1081613 RepID=A0A0B5EQS6_STRA4|nr:ATP-binding region ATPase domain protein [Streptomyces albus]AOU74831.1 ATP-binding region ATPase domain protein [Streptomyces albus]AYN30640.1 ATP-binding region ATPase domain protein [Streptomyces albus]